MFGGRKAFIGSFMEQNGPFVCVAARWLPPNTSGNPVISWMRNSSGTGAVATVAMATLIASSQRKKKKKTEGTEQKIIFILQISFITIVFKTDNRQPVYCTDKTRWCLYKKGSEEDEDWLQIPPQGAVDYTLFKLNAPFHFKPSQNAADVSIRFDPITHQLMHSGCHTVILLLLVAFMAVSL